MRHADTQRHEQMNKTKRHGKSQPLVFKLTGSGDCELVRLAAHIICTEHVTTGCHGNVARRNARDGHRVERLNSQRFFVQSERHQPPLPDLLSKVDTTVTNGTEAGIGPGRHRPLHLCELASRAVERQDEGSSAGSSA